MIRPAPRPRRHRLAAALGVAALYVAQPPYAAWSAVASGEVRATARQVLTNGYYQYQSPGQRDPEALAAEDEIAGSAEDSAADEAVDQALDRRSASPAGIIGRAFLWLLAAVAGLLFAVQSVRLLLARWRRRRSTAVSTTVRAQPAVAEDEPLATADGLARAGQDAEAVRRLLLAALDQLRRRLGSQAAAPSLTAREVMRAPMPARSRAALAILVESEERGRFGGRLVVPATYRACRACYLRLADWLRTRPA